MSHFDPYSYMMRTSFAPNTIATVRGNIFSPTGLALFVDTTIANSWDREDVGSVERAVWIPPWALEDERSFNTFLAWTFTQAAVHESFEWVRVDHEPIINPHRYSATSDSRPPKTRAQAEADLRVVEDVFNIFTPPPAFDSATQHAVAREYLA